MRVLGKTGIWVVIVSIICIKEVLLKTNLLGYGKRELNCSIALSQERSTL
jgi:hypothetical protein